jgi:hypothetical protein
MRVRLIPSLVLVLLVAACGELKSPTDPGTTPDPIDQTATFTRVQNEVFTPTCTQIGCHDVIGQQQGLVLTAGRAYVNTVNVQSSQMPSLQRVRPDDPQNSYLYRKITGAGITGGRMPLQLPPLSDEKIRLVRDWIRRGAPND